MPVWVWIVIVLAVLAVFIPFKVKMTKIFLDRMQKHNEDNKIDE